MINALSDMVMGNSCDTRTATTTTERSEVVASRHKKEHYVNPHK